MRKTLELHWIKLKDRNYKSHEEGEMENEMDKSLER